MPLFVASSVNLEPVPIGAAQISLSFVPPPSGARRSSAHAPRKPLAPVASPR